ncbi:hypothetical protein BDR05DRAFT_860567, partial [Suillus weaverae]
FVDNAEDLVALLDHTATVISGSSVLSLVQAKHGAIIVCDMDVYTMEKFEGEVLKHFKEKEGYKSMQEVVKKTEYSSLAISKIVKLSKGEKEVDLIISDWSCSLAPILQFHTMAVMNYITACSIVCLYLWWTTANKSFINPQMYLKDMTHLHTVHVLMKYKRRGFQV